MASVGGRGDFYVTAVAAQVAIAQLTTLRIHPHFSGYLAVVAAAASAKRRDNLKVNFQQFYDDYMAVAGAPADRPYLQPFSVGGKGVPQLRNPNVAGSYAPSSLRGVAPIRAVVEFAGSGQHVTQTLKDEHEVLALKALAGSEKVPAHSLATFLFRDHKIPRVHASDVESTLAKFCSEFGYDLTRAPSRALFDTLYQSDANAFNGVAYAEA